MTFDPEGPWNTSFFDKVATGWREQRGPLQWHSGLNGGTAPPSAGAESTSKLKPIFPSSWMGQPVEPRKWIVPDMIPADTVTLLAGEGAAGKSILALQLGVARALGAPWLTTPVEPGRTMMLSAEDDEAELKRRLEAIGNHYGVGFDKLDNFCLFDLVAEEAVLGSSDRNNLVRPTALFQSVLAYIEEFRPSLVIIDALADAFAGDEIKRSQARQFISMLRRPAKKLECAFLCLTHPSLTGISSGTGSSGSTAWGNSVRSRMFFEKARAGDGSEPDPDLRTLTVNKSNYGPGGAQLTLKWQNGVYLVGGGIGSIERQAAEKRVEETFLSLLATCNAQGQNLSFSLGPNYAPVILAGSPGANGVGKDGFKAAMHRLVAAGRIRKETYGTPSRAKSRLVACDEALEIPNQTFEK